jgi:hypothetical protein
VSLDSGHRLNWCTSPSSGWSRQALISPAFSSLVDSTAPRETREARWMGSPLMGFACLLRGARTYSTFTHTSMSVPLFVKGRTLRARILAANATINARQSRVRTGCVGYRARVGFPQYSIRPRNCPRTSSILGETQKWHGLSSASSMGGLPLVTLRSWQVGSQGVQG